MLNHSAPEHIPPGFKLRHALRGHRSTISWIAWAPDGQTIASGSFDGTVRLWNAETGRPQHTLRGRTRWIARVAWSPDGRTLASGDGNGDINLWDIESAKARLKFKAHTDWVYALAWSPDGRTLASGGEEDSISLLDVESGRSLPSLRGRSRFIYALAWSPDGRTLASGDASGGISLWDVKSGALMNALIERPQAVLGLAWSPDGSVLACGLSDGAIQVWDAESGKLRIILEGHTSPVSSVSFSPEGLQLASKSGESVRLWRCDTWERIAVLEESSSVMWPSNAAFHPGEANVLATLARYRPLIRIWELDPDAILGSVIRSEDIFYTTAKIALVGDSGAGKTGLGWRLAHGEFRDHPSTHGQQFWVVKELGATGEDGTECEAVVWDLAGQPDYRLVHALFLDDVDVGLVLFDPANRQEPLKGVEYWLKQLSGSRRDGRGRRVILVGARADRGVPTLMKEELEEFCVRHDIEGGYVLTSALTGEGLGELLARLKASVVWSEMPATVTSMTFKRVKGFVLALKEETQRKGVLVSPSELRTLLEMTDPMWKFTDAEMMTAVRHLSNHGYVSVLRGSSGEEAILLAPDLLANLAASFVLEARRNPRGLGALEESRVLAGDYEFSELASLDQRERDLLLDAATILFLEHNLCFRETLGPQTLLIFPALINQKRPLAENIETTDDVSYRVSGAVENVYAALVVQLGYTNTFTRTNQWQNQAEYETARGHVCGFRQVNEREGETELILYYANEREGARLLFQGLFEEFLRGRDVTVTKFPPVACPQCGYRQPRDEVIKRIDDGKGSLFCGECGEQIVLPREGERIALGSAEREELNREQERTRQRTAFETALVRIKAVARDEKKEAPRCFISYARGNALHERWVNTFVYDLQNAGVEVTFDRNDSLIGADIARFISRIEGASGNFVIAVGTQLYRQKYENRVSAAGSLVAAEVNLINLRLTGTNEEAATVLPILLEGDDRSSFPPLMHGKVYADFRQEASYFKTLFELLLRLYQIPTNHKAVRDLRDILRP